jgi:hypothetical protein
VGVGGTGVSVGGTGVSVGGSAVFVGGTGVLVGGAGVSVGGNGVSVSAAAIGAEVGSGAPQAASVKNRTTKAKLSVLRLVRLNMIILLPTVSVGRLRTARNSSRVLKAHYRRPSALNQGPSGAGSIRDLALMLVPQPDLAGSADQGASVALPSQGQNRSSADP